MKKKFGLALSGGSLRGAAHIGVLNVFKENNIFPNIIAGSSAGSIVGALFASDSKFFDSYQLQKVIVNRRLLDWEINFLELLMMGLKSSAIKTIYKKLPNGFIKGERIENLLNFFFRNKSFDECKIPLLVTATDIKTGELIVFTGEKTGLQSKDDIIVYTDVSISEAIRASISIPGIFAPKTIKGRMLVDGGVKNNVPVDLLDHLKVERKIAVDLGYAVQNDESIDNFIEILLQSYDVTGQEISNLKTKIYADLVIRPEVKDMSLLDFHKIPISIRQGRLAAEEKINEIKDILCYNDTN